MYKALSGGYTIISHQRNPSLDADANDKFNTYPPLEGSRAYRVGPGLFRFRSCRFILLRASASSRSYSSMILFSFSFLSPKTKKEMVG